MSADLWMGLAIGAFLPWVIFVILGSKKQNTRNYEEANELLRERNRIGAEMLDVAWETWRRTPTLREKIAAMALQGYLAGRMHDDRPMPEGSAHHEHIAQSCMRYADALMTEFHRNKKI